ncbi:uncharacterized protein LOC142349223 [Convolutriloba macropyga]|uniref:uncharacterized protein LOC142349223 n=1 Tax=Convolutriloba macropyga TaxID=536237 RepID=UPI003F527363
MTSRVDVEGVSKVAVCLFAIGLLIVNSPTCDAVEKGGTKDGGDTPAAKAPSPNEDGESQNKTTASSSEEGSTKPPSGSESGGGSISEPDKTTKPGGETPPTESGGATTDDSGRDNLIGYSPHILLTAAMAARQLF